MLWCTIHVYIHSLKAFLSHDSWHQSDQTVIINIMWDDFIVSKSYSYLSSKVSTQCLYIESVGDIKIFVMFFQVVITQACNANIGNAKALLRWLTGKFHPHTCYRIWYSKFSVVEKCWYTLMPYQKEHKEWADIINMDYSTFPSKPSYCTMSGWSHPISNYRWP